MSDLLRTWIGVVLISFSAVYVRLADVEATRSAFLRTAYAVPVFVVLVWWWRRRPATSGAVKGSPPGRGVKRSQRPATSGAVKGSPPGRGVKRSQRPAFVPMAAAAGAFLALDLVAWHTSIGLIGAGLATVLANLQVVIVALIGVALFRERPRPAFWAALPVVLVGVWLLGATGVPVEDGASVLAGIGFGIATAVAYSVFLVVLRMARVRGGAVLPSMASATYGAAAVTFVFAAVEGVAAPPASLSANGWLVLLALGSQVTGWILLTSSIDRLPAALTSVALLLQPVLAMVWGAVLLAEPIGPAQIVGAGAVLVGVAVAHRAARDAEPDRRTTPAAPMRSPDHPDLTAPG